MMPRAAAVYVRISDDRTGQLAGVKRQEKHCRDLATERASQVSEVYVANDLFAFSGKPRPKYEQLLDDLRSGIVDTVIASHPHRLHRRPVELEEFIDLIEKTGVAVATVTAGDYDLSTPSGRMTARVVGSMARHESEHKSERERRKHLELAQQGKSGRTRPLGSNADRLTLNRDEARLIREAPKRVLAGDSLRGACADRKQRGVRTVTGTEWSTTVLRSIMVVPRTAGLREHQGEVVHNGNGEPVKTESPAIIKRDQHEKLHALLLDPSRRNRG